MNANVTASAGHGTGAKAVADATDAMNAHLENDGNTTETIDALRDAARSAAAAGIPIPQLMSGAVTALRLSGAFARARDAGGPPTDPPGPPTDPLGPPTDPLSTFEDALVTLADAYGAVEMERGGARAEARRAFLEELLLAPPQDRLDALRRRRRAERHGLPTNALRLTLASLGRRRTDAAVDRFVAELRRALGAPSSGRLAFVLPEVTEWRGRIVVLDDASSGATRRLKDAFETAGRRVPRPQWVAVAGSAIPHIDVMAASMARLRDAIRTAERISRSGWIESSDGLDLETLVSLDDDLRSRAIAAELGPLLDDRRSGTTLVETLEAYVASGHNAREAGRRLQIAPRTVTYRLRRVERLLARSLDPELLLRLSVALFAYRLDHRAPVR